MPRKTVKKEELKQILEQGWEERREKIKKRSARLSNGTKVWKAKNKIVQERESQLGRPLTPKEYKTLTGYLKRDLSWMKTTQNTPRKRPVT